MRKRSSEPLSLPPNCLNCGAEIITRYCGECGQENEPPTPTFSAVMKDLWQEFIQVDGKILTTLWFLFARPGFLSAEYIAGRRITYFSPFKLYFWTTALFVLFILRLNIIDAEKLQVAADKVQLETVATPGPGTKPTPKPKKDDTGETFTINLIGKQERVRVTNGKFDGEQALAASLRFGLPRMTAGVMRLLGENINPDTLPESVPAYQEAQKKLREEQHKQQSAGKKRQPTAQPDSLKRQFLSERLIRLKNNPWDGLKALVAAGIPNVLIFCVPIWALIIKLFFPKRLYFEHLVFALHTHVFGVICMAASIGLWTMMPQDDWVHNSILLLIPVYNFLAAKRFYPEHPAWLLLKGTGLSCAYGCILMFAAIFGLIFTLIWTLVSA